MTARSQLGEWLASKPDRWWELTDFEDDSEPGERYAVELFEDGFNMLEGQGFGGYGPTVDAAILDALGRLHEEDR